MPPGPQQRQNDPVNMLGQQVFALLTMMQKLKRNIYRLEAIEKLASAGRKPVYPVEFRSQFGEDAILWELFDGQLDGFFIEVGAFDGYNYAVTYALECLGWKGLLIEAIPERAAQCKERRKNSRVVHSALASKHGGEVTFSVTEDQFGGMLSYLDPHSSHAKGLAGAQKRHVTVPLTTMNELLKDHQGEIDVAVIDVEGGEVPLLGGFDLHKHKPKVLLIEDNARGQDQALANYMSMMPYVQVTWLEVNRVYVRADLAPTFAARLR
jgi:FkbM family methyltransferase